MKLNKLKLNNFFSFGENVEFNMNAYRNLVLIKGDTASADSSNGAGKSSLFEAIYWALTGKTVRGVKAGDVVRNGEKKVNVELSFTHKENAFLISRSWTEAKKELTIKWGAIDSHKQETEKFHDAKQGTLRVFELLGISPEIFSLIGFYGRKFHTFSDLSPKERADLIDLLAQGEVWEKGREEAASKLKDNKVKYTTQKELQDNEQKKLLEVTEAIEALEVQLAELLISMNKELESLESRKTVAMNEYEEAKKGLKDSESFSKERGILTQKLAAVDERKQKEEAALENAYTLESITRAEEIESLNKEIQNSLTTESKLELEALAIEKKAKETRSRKGRDTCIVCLQKLPNPPDNEAIEEEALNYDRDIDRVGKEQQKAEAKSKGLKLVQKEKSDLKEQLLLKTLKEQKELGEVFEAEKTLLSAKLQSLESEEDKCKLKLSEKEAVLTSINSKIKETKNNPTKVRLETSKSYNEEIILNSKEQRETIERNLQILTRKVETGNYLIKAFKDIRFSSFDNTVKTLEELLNTFCRQQNLEFDRIHVSSWKEDSSGDVVPQVNIYVVRGDASMPLNSLSEGETQRVNLACFFTFSMLIEKSIGFPVEFNVLDEPLAGLDYEGRQNVFNIISSLSEDRQIFTIDHDANFQDKFSDAVTIKKIDNISTINPT